MRRVFYSAHLIAVSFPLRVESCVMGSMISAYRRSTIGVEFATHIVMVNNEGLMKAQIWDTGSVRITLLPPVIPFLTRLAVWP